MTPQIVLQASDLWKSFGAVPAVKGASVHVLADEVVALIGPNGAGKTTLFDLLTGRKFPDRGAIKLFGRDVTAHPPWQRVKLGLGRSFQISSIFPSLTACENVQAGMLLSSGHTFSLRGEASAKFRDEAMELLAEVGLSQNADRPGGELSYGDQRALELAVTLSSRPKILLLDEPTAGMGTLETQECLARVKSIAAGNNIPVLFVEHDMSVVFSFATRVVVLAAGEVIFDGLPEAVRADPRVQEVYFGEIL
jgi:branched-chain amino acid transport system ATP-binding protein